MSQLPLFLSFMIMCNVIFLFLSETNSLLQLQLVWMAHGKKEEAVIPMTV